jgi:hypothetical protein
MKGRDSSATEAVMKRINKKIHLATLLAITLAMSACAGGVNDRSDKSPDTLELLAEYFPVPELEPQEVVRIQMAALGANDSEDTGIALAFRFASPQNRRYTGDVDKFASIVRGKGYAPMLENIDFTVGPVERRGQLAVVAVRADRMNDHPAGFLFILSRQDGGRYDGCWMTDSVLRIEVGDDSPSIAPDLIDA